MRRTAVPALNSQELSRLLQHQVQGITRPLDLHLRRVDSHSDLQDIAPLAVGDNVVSVSGVPDIRVVALAAIHAIGPGPSDKGVVPLAAMERVVTFLPQDKIVFLCAVKHISLSGATDHTDSLVDLLSGPDHPVRKDDLRKFVVLARKPVGNTDIFPILTDIEDEVHAVRRSLYHRPVDAGTERQAVFALRVDDQVTTIPQVPRVCVVSLLAPQHIVPLASNQDVVAGAAVDHVVPRKTVDDVGLRGAVQDVVPLGRDAAGTGQKLLDLFGIPR